MASTPVEIQLPSGLTATLSLYPAGTDVLANSGGADTLTESTNAKGRYTATVTEAISGVHFAKVLVGANVVATGYVNLADDTTTYRVVDSYLEALRLDAAISSIASSGSGARTITFTIDDGTDPLENATVRATEGATSVTGTTDASGNVTLNLDDATYTIAITKPGYSYAGSSLVVSADATPTLSMTQVVTPTTSNAGFSTGTMYCYDENGAVESGVNVTIYYTAAPTTDGIALDTNPRTDTSDANGYVEFTNLIRGAKISVKRGDGRQRVMTVPETTPFDLNSVLGAE